MGATLIGFVLGFVVGASSGTELGAFAGGMVGAAIGFAVHAAIWLRARTGDAPVIEHHRVLCTPLGRFADLDIQGDQVNGRWREVKRCSLLAPATQVDCDQGCIRQLRMAGVKCGRGCDCGVTAEAPP